MGLAGYGHVGHLHPPLEIELEYAVLGRRRRPGVGPVGRRHEGHDALAAGKRADHLALGHVDDGDGRSLGVGHVQKLAVGGIRTSDLRIRNPTLYPAELSGPESIITEVIITST